MRHNFKKAYGQNFLRNKKFAIKVADYLQVEIGNIVMEIGPGEGVLTSALLDNGAKVIAIEIDYSLIPNLIKRFGDNENLEIINQDFLGLDLKEAFGKFTKNGEVKVAGSLPYNISKKIIMKLLEFNLEQRDIFISKMSFIVQEEVAQDYVALAPKATFLSNFIRTYADIRKLESIPAGQFYPQPKVNGGILLISPKKDLSEHYKEILKVIRIGFVSPRKTLMRNLKNSNKWEGVDFEEIFNEVGIKSNARAAEVEFEKWSKLFDKLKIN